MEQGIWQEIEALHQKFVKLGISEAVDYKKYYLYSLIAHSTTIEDSTLTEVEAQLLFDEGVVAGGKPLVYHLMNEDLKEAYEQAKEKVRHKAPITPFFLQTLNAALMRTTGSIHNVMGGSFDSSKGEYHLCGVTAGIGGCSYMNYQNFPELYRRIRIDTIQRDKRKDTNLFWKRVERLVQQSGQGKMFGDWNDYGRLLES